MQNDGTISPLLMTEHFTVRYPNKSGTGVLFTDLNLALHSGELVCFMGPNGVGKSTLIRTLAGLQKPLHGTFHYGNKGSENLSEKVAVVLTDRINQANLTVRELISYGRYAHLNWRLHLTPTDDGAINQAIEQLQLQHISSRKIFELSDGQVQMAMIARALAQDTPVILLDEPTAHLDLNNRVEIMNLLRTIASKTSKAILIATHELDLALQTADLIWLANAAQNVITGIPEDLVLNNTFDEIFRFKGYDLKSGKVKLHVHQIVKVSLTGEGHGYLWTKNALERNGYLVVPQNGAIHITLHTDHQKLTWDISHPDTSFSTTTIAALLNGLKQFGISTRNH